MNLFKEPELKAGQKDFFGILGCGDHDLRICIRSGQRFLAKHMKARFERRHHDLTMSGRDRADTDPLQFFLPEHLLIIGIYLSVNPCSEFLGAFLVRVAERGHPHVGIFAISFVMPLSHLAAADDRHIDRGRRFLLRGRT